MKPEKSGLAKHQNTPCQLETTPLSEKKLANPEARFQIVWLLFLTALVATSVEGAIRKWVFPQAGAVKSLMYFSKDLLFAAILLFPRTSLPSPEVELFTKWLRPGCTIICLGVALSATNGVNPVGAVLTTRALLILPVLACLVISRIRDLPIQWTSGLLATLALINFTLGLEQNSLPRDHFLNRYADSDLDIVAVESGVRASGTFAYITGLGVISTVGIWAGLTMMSFAKTQWQRAGAWVTLASGFGCGLASVSRAPVAIGAAIVAGWLIAFRGSFSLFLRGLLMGALCFGVAYELNIIPAFANLGTGLKDRNNTAGDSFQERAFGQLGETIFAMQHFPFGNGYGTEQTGGQYYAVGMAGFNNVESPMPRLVMETGILGLLGYLIIATGAVMALQKAKQGTTAENNASLLASQLVLGAMFYGNIVFNHTASAFIWMIFAAVIAGTEKRSKNVDSYAPALRPHPNDFKRAIGWQKH